MLVKHQTDQPCSPGYSSTDCTWNAATENDKLIYLRIEWPSLWEQAKQAHERFAWWEYVGKKGLFCFTDAFSNSDVGYVAQA